MFPERAKNLIKASQEKDRCATNWAQHVLNSLPLGNQMALPSPLSLHSLDNLFIPTCEQTCLPALPGRNATQMDCNSLLLQLARTTVRGNTSFVLSAMPDGAESHGTKRIQGAKFISLVGVSELEQTFQNRSTRYALLQSLNFIMKAMFNSS